MSCICPPPPFTGTLGEESKQFCSHQLTGSCFSASLPSPPSAAVSDCQSGMKKSLSDSSFLNRGILSTAQSCCIHSPERSTTGRHLDHSCSVREHGINHRCRQRLMSSSSARGLFLSRLSSRRQKMALLPIFPFFSPTGYWERQESNPGNTLQLPGRKLGGNGSRQSGILSTI